MAVSPMMPVSVQATRRSGDFMREKNNLMH
jgi:hypothetical protein